MRRKYFLTGILSVLCVFLSCRLNAQTIIVGDPNLDDYYRREQLLGHVDSNISFTVRPLFVGYSSKANDIYDPDSSLAANHWVKAGPIHFAKKLGVFQILPVHIQQQFNSNQPYGWNDGSMIPARGYQTRISGGIFLKFGPLTIQLQPEYVYAQNNSFNGFATGKSAQDLANYNAYFGAIDQPERFGTVPFKKMFLGQSSIRLTFSPISIGLSNENVWWGPGIRNALILSNNAPGFKHLTLNTVKPVKTPIGHFEMQVLAARLDNSNFALLSGEPKLVTPQNNDWRYFTGLNINYHPKWIPGLTVGLIRTFNAYRTSIKTFSDYVPFFFPYQKQNTNDGDPVPRDQITSFYARWLFKKAKAEVYFEYGLNDNSYNYRDFIGSPDHSRAYVFGLRKIIPFNAQSTSHLLLSGEITQLSQTPDRVVRTAGTWYTHYQVREGHTNQGQVLGAGTGPGGNLQSFDVKWISGLKSLGIGFERYEHNVDFSDTFLSDVYGNKRKWVDFAIALQGQWNYRNLLFNAKLQHINSLNYQWILKDFLPGQYYVPHNTVNNFHAELGVTFRF
ncbi:capsule assembly Wzi family protein [Mucilaginibacter calamicampi]|uniref:Capsule assembly Wzi family protein n=1 Tax=Mucilaginibacter calamicampi TaxID=1302352 RepID=A0ABW2YYH9_9SPHI